MGRLFAGALLGFAQFDQLVGIPLAVAQGVDKGGADVLLGLGQLGEIEIVGLRPGQRLHHPDTADHVLLPAGVEAAAQQGEEGLVLAGEPRLSPVGQLRVGRAQSLDQGVLHPPVPEELGPLVVGVHHEAVPPAAGGGQGLQQGGEHRVGRVGQGAAPPGQSQGLHPAWDGHSPLGTEHRVGQGEGVQEGAGAVGTVRGQQIPGELAEPGKDGSGLFQRLQGVEGPPQTEVVGGQGSPGDGPGAQPVPQFV